MRSLKFILSLGFVLSGCASVNSVSLTSIPPQRSQVVKSEASKVIVLGLNFNNDFVDEVSEGLQAQCPKGKVSGILTKDEVMDYFLYMVYKRRITAQGFCVTSNDSRAERVSQGVN